MGRSHKFSGSTIVPQNPAIQPLSRRGGFWWCWTYITACPALSLINISISLFAWETLLVMRYSFCFTYVALLSFQCTRRVFNKFPLRGNANPTVVDGVGSWVEIILFVAFLGNLYRLNAIRLALYIRSKVGGHFLYVQTLQSFQIPKPSVALKVLITSVIKP